MAPEDLDPVRSHSRGAATRRPDEERLERIRRFSTAPADEVTRHLRKLDKEWDIERRLEANASVITLAIQGWCPPIEVFRHLGARSRNEIDAERTAIKALQGHFDDLPDDGSVQTAEQALEAAGRR